MFPSMKRHYCARSHTQKSFELQMQGHFSRPHQRNVYILDVISFSNSAPALLAANEPVSKPSAPYMVKTFPLRPRSPISVVFLQY